MNNYKIWYDPIENKYWLKFDMDKEKIEITNEQYNLIYAQIIDKENAKSEGAMICYEELAYKIRENVKEKENDIKTKRCRES